jgi:hypothetical protein
LQQIQLLAHRDSHGLAPWSATGNRSAKPTFQFEIGDRRNNHRILKRPIAELFGDAGQAKQLRSESAGWRQEKPGN